LKNPNIIEDFSSLVAGVDKEVPLLSGEKRRYVNLDNAATTPPFIDVINAIDTFAGWYSSVHRGTGYKSLISTKIYNQCRRVISDFVGADPDFHTVIFCHNTTDAINKICQCQCMDKNVVVLTTIMEHHSNLLPWRFCCNVDYVDLNPADGSLDLASMKDKLEFYKGRVRLVAVTGASNIAGFMPPIKEIARLAHQYGAKILVDAAQLIAHRTINMGRGDEPDHIDFLAFSAHKMYAPFGSGALIGPKECFRGGRPFIVGGGAVEIVTLDEVIWSEAPEREEAGTPNLFGALAVARAAQMLQKIGMERVAAHERHLTGLMLSLLKDIPGIKIYGDSDASLSRDRVSVIPILSERYNHALLAAILGYEWGIGVRHGCFCAQPYVVKLLNAEDPDAAQYVNQIINKDRGSLPGFVRISFGIYNTADDAEYLALALREIMKNGARYPYRLEKSAGEYFPLNSDIPLEHDFL